MDTDRAKTVSHKKARKSQEQIRKFPFCASCALSWLIRFALIRVYPCSSVVDSYRVKRARYSAASTNPSTMRRESDGFASSATIQFRYKASGSRCKYPKYSITTNAWL